MFAYQYSYNVSAFWASFEISTTKEGSPHGLPSFLPHAGANRFVEMR